MIPDRRSQPRTVPGLDPIAIEIAGYFSAPDDEPDDEQDAFPEYDA